MDVSLKDANKLQRISNIRFLIVTVIFIVLMGSLILFRYSRVVANQAVVEKMAQKVKIAVIHRGREGFFSHEYFTRIKQEGK